MAATISPWIVDVNEETFQKLVVEQSREKPVVIDFWGPSCGPCRTLSPILEKLTREQKGAVILAKVNVEECPELAGYFQIEHIPTVVAVKEGRLVPGFTGALPESRVREFFARLLPEPGDPILLRARALEDTKPAEAETLYRKAFDKDPSSVEVRLGLARVLVQLNKDSEVPALLEPIPNDGDAGAEVQRIRSILSLRSLSAGVSSDEAALRKQIEADPNAAQPRYELGCALAQKGKHQDALEMLLSAAERDPTLASTKVREAMVQIFYTLGPSHPLSDKYRAKLARLLY
jgi:putative thioredoxin